MPNSTINIRLAQAKDTAAIVGIYAPYILNTTTSFEMKVPTITEFQKRIDKVQALTPWLICTIDHVVAAYAYASEHRSRQAYQWTREVSVYVHPDYQKRKIATALYTALIDLLKLQGFSNVLAGITLPNPKSIAFHQNFGFQLIGTYHNTGFKMGQYRDVAWFELFIANKNLAPQKIKKLETVAQTKEWQHIIQQAISIVRD